MNRRKRWSLGSFQSEEAAALVSMEAQLRVLEREASHLGLSIYDVYPRVALVSHIPNQEFVREFPLGQPPISLIENLRLR